MFSKTLLFTIFFKQLCFKNDSYLVFDAPNKKADPWFIDLKNPRKFDLEKPTHGTSIKKSHPMHGTSNKKTTLKR